MANALPAELQLNACWFDTAAAAPAAVTGALAGTALKWVGTNPVADRRHLAPEPDADFSKWTDPRVGWGVILPEKPGTAPDAPDDFADAPEPIRRLIADRKAKLQTDVPVFRYDKSWDYRYSLLRCRTRNKTYAFSGSPYGMAFDEVPYYLLISGSPADIPWDFQYVLNATHAVGRLDLDDAGLDYYVTALIAGWPVAAEKPTADLTRAVVWAVDHSAVDITRLMREVIAEPLFKKFQADPAMKSDLLAGVDAGGGKLIQKLAEARPGLVVTTSHGQTFPTAAAERDVLRATLGVPVDRDFQVLDTAKLLAKWDAYGAVWYAHACCSAGGDGLNRFDGLLAAGSPAKTVLTAVAALGAMSAPLPRALLGAARPIRAFIGHVEPTFNWTLRHPLTGQELTRELVRVLYNNLYNHHPVGHALKAWLRQLGGLREAYDLDRGRIITDPAAQGPLLYAALAAKDVESTVVLGDPTAAL